MDKQNDNTGQAREVTGTEARELDAKYPTDVFVESCGQVATTADDGTPVARYFCTREAGHTGPCIAHGMGGPLATWEAK